MASRRHQYPAEVHALKIIRSGRDGQITCLCTYNISLLTRKTHGEFALVGKMMISESEKSASDESFNPQYQLSEHNHGQPHHLPTRTAPLPPTSDLSSQPQQQRSLPSREVTDDNLDDAYADFIMYCNPSIPLDTDVAELKKNFRALPKSDGKTFNIFTLFGLIRKLESKEIGTWAQLALELGVEPPALDKGQSAQKVQQYAVRLKRWMHAMHVDAFFEYLLSKGHIYWTQVSTADDMYAESGRDGVAAGEDLALRALLPETRPKRGRKKAEDREDSETGKSPSQRPRRESPTPSEDYMAARSPQVTNSTAPENFRHGFNDGLNPWSAIEMRGAATFKWPPPDGTETPLSAYPQSAITPTNPQLHVDANEPRSAVTPKSRTRRRHGPAVSSAWPSNGSSSSGKLRGRPPNNRQVQDGPFSTFRVNPSLRNVTILNLRDNNPATVPIVADASRPDFLASGLGRESAARADNRNQSNQHGRPSGLQLQVPQRQGGTVRLATPPPVLTPVVLLNGKNSPDTQQDMQQDPIGHHKTGFQVPVEYFTATDADPSMPNLVNITFRQNGDTDRTNMDALESHFICEILGADWYDASGAGIERCSIEEADKICKQVVKNLQAESSSTEAFLINLSALAGGPLMTRLRMTKLEQGSAVFYQCHWKMRFGSLEGGFTIRAKVQQDESNVNMVDESGLGGDDAIGDWKKRYLDLQQQIRKRDDKVGTLQRNVLDALLNSQRFTNV